MIGHTINNYEVTHLLGEGGMGSVYEAMHPVLDRKAAIKVLKPEFCANPELVQRFINEARAANAIHHPNIIDIIDVGLLPEGIPYMMMEYLAGETLANRLSRVNRLPLEEALKFTLQTATALGAAHAVGIVHRDLKPENLFLDFDPQNPEHERVKVLDFGIAKLRADYGNTTPTTKVGMLLGTPIYMSPEQCRGNAVEIDHRSDIYSLGVILYEMLCGQPPFVGKALGYLLIQHVMIEPLSPRHLQPDLPEHVEFAILKALRKEVNDRIQSMEEFSALLETNHLFQRKTRKLSGKRGLQVYRRAKQAAIGMGALALFLIVFGVWVLFNGRLVPGDLQSQVLRAPRNEPTSPQVVRLLGPSAAEWAKSPPEDSQLAAIANSEPSSLPETAEKAHLENPSSVRKAQAAGNPMVQIKAPRTIESGDPNGFSPSKGAALPTAPPPPKPATARTIIKREKF